MLKYLNALGDTKKMQVVYNTRLGLLWEDRGDVQDEDTMLGRREEYPAELPDGVLVLTAGVDTQDDRMEYEIVGFGTSGKHGASKKASSLVARTVTRSGSNWTSWFSTAS